jgi:hypothetical protein
MRLYIIIILQVYPTNVCIRQYQQYMGIRKCQWCTLVLLWMDKTYPIKKTILWDNKLQGCQKPFSLCFPFRTRLLTAK